MANERYVNSFIDLDLQEVHTKDEFFSFNVTPNNIKGKPNNPIEYSATISWKLSYFFQPIITNYFFKIKLGATKEINLVTNALLIYPQFYKYEIRYLLPFSKPQLKPTCIISTYKCTRHAYINYPYETYFILYILLQAFSGATKISCWTKQKEQ